ncbi:MAG: hypothetical protein CL819_08960, partial [Croceicoccus sp.]|nr:hypothetical protein [Croceicoccus sp.]
IGDPDHDDVYGDAPDDIDAEAAMEAEAFEPEPSDETFDAPEADDVLDLYSLQAQIVSLTGMVRELQAEVAELRANPPKKAKAKKAKSSSPRASKLNLRGMIDAGLVTIGDELAITDRDGITHAATLASHREVKTDCGLESRINAWGEACTGWKACNVYENVRHVATGKTLDELRSEAQA